MTNCVAVLLSFNLLKVEFNGYKHAHFYTFNHCECLLRLSMPRYLGSMTKNASETPSMKTLVKFAIMREIFLAGSLLKSEIGQLLARHKKRNANILSKVGSLKALQTIVDSVCDELTLESILVGVSSNDKEVTLKDQKTSAKTEEANQVGGVAKKRQAKNAVKNEQKMAKLVEEIKEAAEDAPLGDTPLKLNFSMLVAIERRQAVL